MSFCSNCGTKITAEDKFCPECGHPNEAQHSSVAPATISAPHPEAGAAAPQTRTIPSSSVVPGATPKLKKKLSGCAIAGIVGGSLLALFIILGLVIFGVVYSASSGAVEATRNHLTFLKNGNIEAAYAGTSSGFQSATSLDQYRQFVSSYPVLSDVVSSSFSDRSVENGVANLSGTITDSRGAESSFRARLVKENETWKIVGIDLTGGNSDSSGNPSGGNSDVVSSVGTITIGAGRKPDGSLINPGRPIPVDAADLSADIELINHPLGERVQIWIEQGTNRTEAFEATVEGAGNGNITFDLPLANIKFPQGQYLLVVTLAEERRFTMGFELR